MSEDRSASTGCAAPPGQVDGASPCFVSKPEAPLAAQALRVCGGAAGSSAGIAVWRLAVMGMALGLGLILSSFWLFRRFPLPFYFYGQLLPVFMWLCGVLPPPRTALKWPRLCGASLTVAGLAPFLTWHLRSDGNAYFGVCVLLLLGAVVWQWLETLLLLRQAAERGGHDRLAKAVRRSLGIVLYGVVIPLCAAHGAFLMLLLTVGGGMAVDLGMIWNTQPKIIGDIMRILVFWGGCHVLVYCLAAAVLSGRRRPAAPRRQDASRMDVDEEGDGDEGEEGDGAGGDSAAGSRSAGNG